MSFKITTIEGKQCDAVAGSSILDAVLNSHLIFQHSCKNGQCGVCKTMLLSGEVIEMQQQVALSEDDKKSGSILTCCCEPKSNVLIDAEELSALKDIEIKTFPARINGVEILSDHIVEVELRLPPTTNFLYLEGQFIDVIAPQGVRRSYSVANAANEKTIKLLIKKVEDGVLSQYWFNEAKEGDLLRIEGPKGSFYFREPKKNIIFMATGTGIAPVKSILDKLSGAPDLSKNISFSLYWGNRQVDDFFWDPKYTSLDLNYVPVLSKNDTEWEGRVGYIQDIVIEDGLCLSDTQVYACGSLQMIKSTSELFMTNGLEEKHFYSDAFVSS